MTDKIMINGVDVSGCEFYRDDNGIIAPDGTAERTELCSLTNGYCGATSNCLYKQLQREKLNSQEARDIAIKEFNRAEELSCLLKRKEKECEKWKSAYYNSTTEVKADLIQKVDELKDKLIWFEHYKQSALENKERCDKLIDELQAEKEKVRELEKDLKNSFEEKTKLNTIIDRLLLNSGYNQCTASAEDFEDIYQNMEYKREKFKEYKQALEVIKEIAEMQIGWDIANLNTNGKSTELAKQILQKCEVLEDV